MAPLLSTAEPLSLGNGKGAFFIHNWRCAGSSLNSLLASNFKSSYTKVGAAFSEYGWPDPSRREIQTLGDLRRDYRPGSIVGGHLAMGLESFLPGSWAIWINAREPLARIESGIIRFYASGKIHKKESDLLQDSPPLKSDIDIEVLLSNKLGFERNGISRRIAGLSASNNCQISDLTNLERLELASCDISDDQLFECANRNLSKIDLVVIAEHMQASILCMEKLYDMPPLINLFSDLRHNSGSLSRANNAEIELVKSSRHIIHKHAGVDIRIWGHLKNMFNKQLNRTCISRKNVLIREIIHKEPLLHPSILTRFEDDLDLCAVIANKLARRALLVPEVSQELVSTVCSWARLDEEYAERIRHLCLEEIKRSV